MSLKLNSAFLEAYIELDNACKERFGFPRNGVTEYIKRLNECRADSGCKEILPIIHKYRHIRNRLAHEEGALSQDNDIGRADITRLMQMAKSVAKGKDPLSLYHRKAKIHATAKTAKTVIILLLALAALIGIFTLLKFLGLI